VIDEPDKAVSPVVGVILMVGISVALLAVVAPVMLGSLSLAQPDPPQVSLAFEYDEGAEFSETDDFGTVGDSADADGLMNIFIDSGPDRVNAERLEVDVDGTGSNWAHHHTDYIAGEALATGDDVAIWANRGDSVQIIWTAEDRETSFILDEFTVPENGIVTGGPPTPDYNCDGWDWPDDFDDKPGISAGGDLEIDGVILECDLSEYYDDISSLKVGGGGGLIGYAKVNDDIGDMSGGGTIWGDAYAPNGLDFDEASQITQDAEIKDDVSLSEGSQIGGSLDTAEDGDLDMNINSRIVGDVTSDGTVYVNSGSTVEGTVTANGDIDIQGGSTVEGDVHGRDGQTVYIHDSTVIGDVATEGELNDIDNGNIGGDVYLENADEADLTCSGSSTINGKDCPDYKSDGDVKDYSNY